MKKSAKIFLLFLLNCSIASPQFIEEIIDYKPAPGQFINLPSTGVPEAALSIRGENGGFVCLGSIGGYIVFRFDEPVVNDDAHPFGVDFTLFGNSLPAWAEPAAVYIMKDENDNGIADDTWYLLAGSDYFFSTTRKDHTIRYYEPELSTGDIKWVNNLGETGYVPHNSFHSQPYYPDDLFSSEFYQDSCEFMSIKIEGKLDPNSPEGIKSLPRKFGFADNKSGGNPDLNYPDNPYTKETEGYGGDSFDLSWAVDKEGNYVDIDTAHFIKVQTAMYSNPDILGEISTELRGGRLSKADHSITGKNEILIVEDIPDNISPGSLKLRAYYFINGRYIPDENISWITESEEISISPDGLLEINENIDLEVYASVKNGQLTSDPVRINLSGSLLDNRVDTDRNEQMGLYPNPAHDYLFLKTKDIENILILDIHGRSVKQIHDYSSDHRIDISDLPSGIYFLKADTFLNMKTLKFIKQ